VFEDWPTLEEVVQRTGLSERTLHRLIAKNKVRREYRRLVGRKPVSIIDPESVAALAQPLLHPLPETLPTVTPPPAIPPAALPQPDLSALSALLAGLGITGVPLDKKIYLTLSEAVQLSGLPRTHLRRCIADGSLPAKKLGGWRIRRSDLEAL